MDYSKLQHLINLQQENQQAQLQRQNANVQQDEDEKDAQNRDILVHLVNPLNPETLGKELKNRPAQGQHNMLQDQEMDNLNLITRQEFQIQYRNFSGKDNLSIVVNDQNIDLWSLYSTVSSLGGFEKVVSNKSWGKVAMELGFESSGNIIVLLRRCYIAHLLTFEEKFVLGRSTNAVLGTSERQMKNDGSVAIPTPPKTLLPSKTLPKLAARPALTKSVEQTTEIGKLPRLSRSKSSQPSRTSTPQPKASNPSVLQPRPIIPPPPNLYTTPIVTEGLIPDPPQPDASGKKPLFMPRIYSPKTIGGVDVDKIAQLNLSPLPMIKEEYGSVEVVRIILGLKSKISSEIAYNLDLLLVLSKDQDNVLILSELPGILDTLFQVLFDNLKTLTMIWNSNHPAQSMQDLYKATTTKPKHLFSKVVDSLSQLSAMPTTSLNLVEMTKEFILTMVTILRNLTFVAENVAILCKDQRLLQVILYSLSLEPMACHSACQSVWTSSFILELAKNSVIILSNIASGLTLTSGKTIMRIFNVLMEFIVPFSSRDYDYYRYPALDAIAKLMLSLENAEEMAKLAEQGQLDFLLNKLLDLIPMEPLNSSWSTEHVATLELILINISTIMIFSDRIPSLLAKRPGFVRLMITFSRYPSASREKQREFHLLCLRAVQILKDIANSEGDQVSLYETDILNMTMTDNVDSEIVKGLGEVLQILEKDKVY